MTKTEKILLVLAALFFLAAVFLLPRTDAAERARPAYTLPGPTPAAAEAPDSLWVTLTRRIDLNHADAEELTALPGVGAVTARAIVDYREANGPFASLEDLLKVPGVGLSTLNAIREAEGNFG